MSTSVLDRSSTGRCYSSPRSFEEKVQVQDHYDHGHQYQDDDEYDHVDPGQLLRLSPPPQISRLAKETNEGLPERSALLVFSSNGKKFHGTSTSTDHKSWMSSKMRFMRKLRNSGHGLFVAEMGSNSNVADDGDGFVRVCSDCRTTKTPLWRGGPQGPKSLCNACGIRQRKARKAAAAAAAAVDDDREFVAAGPAKKRCRFLISSEKLIDGDEETTTTTERKSKPTSFDVNGRSSDEREAAILLMALSSDMMFS